MTPTRWWLIGLGTAGLALAADKAPVTSTEHVAFPHNGVLRLKKSLGELTIEGQDRADVEITATGLPDKVRVATETHGEELVINTISPRHRPWSPATGPGLEYNIKVPRSAQVIVEHEIGEVHLADISGEIRASARKGEITVRLPETSRLHIDARSSFGGVKSDFPGHEKRRAWLVGHQMTENPAEASQSLHLRIAYGDILILRERTQPPASQAQ